MLCAASPGARADGGGDVDGATGRCGDAVAAAAAAGSAVAGAAAQRSVRGRARARGAAARAAASLQPRVASCCRGLVAKLLLLLPRIILGGCGRAQPKEQRGGDGR